MEGSFLTHQIPRPAKELLSSLCGRSKYIPPYSSFAHRDEALRNSRSTLSGKKRSRGCLKVETRHPKTRGALVETSRQGEAFERALVSSIRSVVYCGPP